MTEYPKQPHFHSNNLSSQVEAKPEQKQIPVLDFSSKMSFPILLLIFSCVSQATA